MKIETIVNKLMKKREREAVGYVPHTKQQATQRETTIAYLNWPQAR